MSRPPVLASILLTACLLPGFSAAQEARAPVVTIDRMEARIVEQDNMVRQRLTADREQQRFMDRAAGRRDSRPTGLRLLDLMFGRVKASAPPVPVTGEPGDPRRAG